jgi:hypothetical protein
MRYPYVVTYRESFMEKMYYLLNLGVSALWWITAKGETCFTRLPAKNS